MWYNFYILRGTKVFVYIILIQKFNKNLYIYETIISQRESNYYHFTNKAKEQFFKKLSCYLRNKISIQFMPSFQKNSHLPQNLNGAPVNSQTLN